MAEYTTDLVIIGAGPVGLFAVFQAGMLRMRAHVVDALPAPGGQCSALYPEKPIYDIPGYPSIMAAELVEQMEKQAAPFAPVYHLGERVEKVARITDDSGRMTEGATSSVIRHPSSGWQVETSRGTIIHCKAVMIVAGCGAFGPNRPPLAGIEEYEGKSVHYLVSKREDFRGKRVVIAGGGDSAVDWAISLSKLAQVSVVHRRDKFRCAPESAARLKALADAGKIVMVVPYQLAGLKGAGGQLSGVEVSSLDGGARTLPADVLLPFFGLSMELGPIAEWGLALEQGRLAVNPATCETNEKGIFAVGDIAHYPGKLKLILCGFSEAAMAAHAAYPLVHPDEALHFEYSTTRGVPGT